LPIDQPIARRIASLLAKVLFPNRDKRARKGDSAHLG
jgi:hypothetical protein